MGDDLQDLSVMERAPLHGAVALIGHVHGGAFPVSGRFSWLVSLDTSHVHELMLIRTPESPRSRRARWATMA